MATHPTSEALSPQDIDRSQSDLIYDGLRIQLEPAPFWPRVLALCIDLSLLYFVTLVVFFIALIVGGVVAAGLGYTLESIGFRDHAAAGVLLVLVAVVVGISILGVTHGYFIYYEYKKHGQTPGKRLMGLKVVTLNGNPLSLGKCCMREMMRYIDTMLVFPGLLSYLLTQKRQRLGDILAGTMVSYSRYDSEEGAYTYVKQGDYLYLRETLNPQPVPEDQMRSFLAFAYKEFILSKQTQERYQEKHITWEQMACRYLPPSEIEGLDQLTILLFFAEYCQQTMNRVKK